ncbi:MAG: DUF2236 domain-containing protein [Chloroflexi bacterium]|nr:DUF2236 domain-containing protein [Chloroflexota bacterium]
MPTGGGPRPDPILGFYGPGSMMWRINREAVLLGSGPTALLLQIAHPHVAEGVARHSDFAAAPFRRLEATIHTTMGLVFGDGVRAERAVRRLNGVHAGVRGEAIDPVARGVVGAAYRALDPDLLLWVQATLIMTSVRAYERWVHPLSMAERDRFWSEARSVGVRIGIPLARSPADWAAFERYWAEMLAIDGPIQVTPTALRLAPMIVRPPIPLVPGPLLDLAALPGLALLPERIRAGFGLAWGPGRETIAAAAAVELRTWVRLMPPGWRAMPQARAAERRARRVRGDRPAGRSPSEERLAHGR